MPNDNHDTAQALRQIAEIVERGEWGREARRLADRKILGALDDRGCRVPGPLLERYNELTRQAADGDGMDLELHALRSALARLGDLMRKGAPPVAARAGIAETLRKAATAIGGEAQKSDDWSEARSPSEWAKALAMSLPTLKRRVKDGKIRVQKITTKSWRVHKDDLPG